MDAVVPLLILLLLPPLLYLVSRKAGVTYHWGTDALHVQAGFRKHLFPYASTTACLTSQPLGARMWGTAAPGTVTGRFIVNGSEVHALATTARPQQALLLIHGRDTFYVTPENPANFLDRFRSDLSSLP
ncbi:PH domain-containing protein [Deinococcus arcticus]|uniref:Bacterial Pleckstrin homology domain-containing protein n=1 Tax=Deinococcus arcticus TaxID=2136176 RepID=A0A2T3W468_9DEIO|nr:PH domain-containing protein [Deinococcus arcticus]PTA66695.1 hypothetical protein C8263_16350 [Deinococcus arcticus]